MERGGEASSGGEADVHATTHEERRLKELVHMQIYMRLMRWANDARERSHYTAAPVKALRTLRRSLSVGPIG